MLKRGALIAAVVLAIGAFACERKHDENKAGETTTTSGTVHEEQGTGSNYNYQGSPGVTGTGPVEQQQPSTAGVSTGTDRNVTDVSGAGGAAGTSGAAIEADQMSTYESAKDAGVANDFEKKDGGHAIPPSTSKAKSGDSQNKSTTLGDGTSGMYTGGKGTYGGKATQGTGEKK